MKIYNVKTQEAYDELMKELEEKGYKWENGDLSTEVNTIFRFYDSDTCVRVDDNNLKILGVDIKPTYNKYYPEVEIIEYKGKNKMTTVEYNNVFPKDIYEEMKKYALSSINDFWKRYEDCEFPIDVDKYITNNQAKISIALGTGNFECEKEPLYYVHLFKGDEYSYFNLGFNGQEDCLTSKEESNDYKTKFTEAEIKAINPVYWNETFLEPVDEEVE